MKVFLAEVWTWQRDYYEMSPQTRVSRAKKLIALFVNFNALYEINISNAQRQRIINAVHAADASLRAGGKDATVAVGVGEKGFGPDVFLEARSELAHILSNSATNAFLPGESVEEARNMKAKDAMLAAYA